MTAGTETETEKDAEDPSPGYAVKSSLLTRIGGLFNNVPDGELVTPTSEPVALRTNSRIVWDGEPFKLTLGEVALEFHPDLSITGDDYNDNREWIVHPGRAFYESDPKFIRIGPAETVLMGRADEVQERIFAFDKSVAKRHVKISNSRGALTIQPLESEKPITISTIDTPTAVWAARRDNLLRLPDLLGHPLTEFDDEQAIDIARDVNGLLAAEVYRDPDDDGVPGGIIRFPDDMTVVIMGDIHAQADNVLRVITEGGLLTALERDEACLVFLGDLVHAQEPGELENMDSSIFILDLFFLLKRRFPENVFYIQGNHESFSPDVGKAGVPQGVLFRKRLRQRRGKAYVAEIEKLFDGLAFIAEGNDFAACHGAPVRSKVNRDTLVNIKRYPGIQSELVWNRLQQGNRPEGYAKGSVRRFRRTLNLSRHAPLVVAHTPLSSADTLWLNVGGIVGHHVVYSAHGHRVAAMVLSDGQTTPLEFITEPALAYLNDGPDA